jgi:hypothetical protein
VKQLDQVALHHTTHATQLRRGSIGKRQCSPKVFADLIGKGGHIRTVPIPDIVEQI